MSFFSASTIPTTRTLPSLVPRCGACGLFKDCKSPKMPANGEGRKGILIIAEAPGKEEDERGIQLVGEAGKYLRSVLDRFDVDLDRDCWKTNALICRPPDNRTPTSDEVDHCRPNVLKAIKELEPRHIIPLGLAAVRSLLGPLWKEDVGTMTQWAGWQIPLQKYNAWVTPNYHPSYVLRTEDDKNGPVVKIWFERYLREALKLEGRPWEKVPDYSSQVKIVLDPNEVAKILREFLSEGKAISFDYETNMLKPDKVNAEIVSCAVSNGTRTIAYPWIGNAIAATSELLLSPIPKLGANTKFEERWTRRILKHGVRNWAWDCMNNAHLLDNREDSTSVKFQGFVRTGIEPWNNHIEEFLKAEKEDGTNRIREIDIRSLLLYNGIDALVEYVVAVDQRKELKTRAALL